MIAGILEGSRLRQLLRNSERVALERLYRPLQTHVRSSILPLTVVGKSLSWGTFTLFSLAVQAIEQGFENQQCLGWVNALSSHPGSGGLSIHNALQLCLMLCALQTCRPATPVDPDTHTTDL